MSTNAQGLYPTGQYERQPADFYPTPAWVTQCLVDTAPLSGIIWEPCAGKGAMAKVLADAGHHVVATDLLPYDDAVFPVVSGIDALRAPLPAGARIICTNPPYGDLPSLLVERWLGLLARRRSAGLAVAGTVG